MIRKALLVAAALLVPAISQAQVKLLRHPTYSKGKVAFSYLGDIWVANENGTDVRRLTDNTARDVYPRFSPDGQWIAFSSNRDGNYDVYVIPAAGGKPRQLTFHSANDTVAGWTPDGRKILFSSVRAKGAFPTVATLFEVPLEGGVEQPVPTDWGASGSYSPDGKKLAFMRHPSVWSRKHYRGAYAADLWVMDVAAKNLHEAQRAGRLQGQLAVADVRQSRRDLLRLRPHGRREGHPLRRAGSDEERQQHLEDLRPGRQAGAGDASRRRQPLLPQHLGGRQGDRVRGQLRALETRHGERQEHRNPHRHPGGPQGKRYRARHHQQRGGGLPHFAVEPPRRHRGARRDLHHRDRPRRAAARYRNPLARAGAALVAGRQVDRLRLRPHRPPGGLDRRRARQERRRS